MNYQKHYDALISRGLNRVLDGYKEYHHIIPRCLGGSNDKSNMVYLTGIEHKVAHRLLSKLNPTHVGLRHAAKMMTGRGPWNKGVPMTDELRKKVSESKKGKSFGGVKKGNVPWNAGLKGSQIPWNKGIKNPKFSESRLGHIVSEETRNKISESLKGNIPWNKGLPSPRKGKQLSEETKAKMRASWIKRNVKNVDV